MEKHPIENILSSTMENLNQMIDVDKVIGHPVLTTGGATVLPVSSIAFGFTSGGGEYDFAQNKRESYPFAGGSGAGVSVKPDGFLVISGEVIRYLPIQKNSCTDKLIDLVPQVVEQVKDLCKKKAGEQPEEDTEDDDELFLEREE